MAGKVRAVPVVGDHALVVVPVVYWKGPGVVPEIFTVPVV